MFVTVISYKSQTWSISVQQLVRPLVLSEIFQSNLPDKALAMKGYISWIPFGIFLLKTCLFTDTHTHISLNACARMLAYILTQVVFRGSGGFLLACFQRLMWPGVLLCEHTLTRVLCMPLCVCSHFCHFTVTTCQPPPLSAVHQFPLSLSLSASLLSVPISLSLSLRWTDWTS